jgi:hypothetical protein
LPHPVQASLCVENEFFSLAFLKMIIPRLYASPPPCTVARVQARDLSTYNRYNVQHDSRILTCSLGSEHPLRRALYYSLPPPPASGATFIPAISSPSDLLFHCQFLFFLERRLSLVYLSEIIVIRDRIGVYYSDTPLQEFCDLAGSERTWSKVALKGNEITERVSGHHLVHLTTLFEVQVLLRIEPGRSAMIQFVRINTN